MSSRDHLPPILRATLTLQCFGWWPRPQPLSFILAPQSAGTTLKLVLPAPNCLCGSCEMGVTAWGLGLHQWQRRCQTGSRTFSTLAYFLMSISLRPLSSSSTVRTASSAMPQASSDQRLRALVLMAEWTIFSIMERSDVSTGVLRRQEVTGSEIHSTPEFLSPEWAWLPVSASANTTLEMLVCIC